MASYRETIDRVMAGDYDQASEEERKEAVSQVIQLCSIGSAAVAVQPFPFLDTLLLSPIQIGMVQAIGRIHGHRLDSKSILEILSTFGASIVAQNVILAAAKFVPVLGWAVGISMAYALTWAIGEVSDYYFKNGRGVPQEELRERFQRVFREKRAEKEASARANDRLKDRLEQLKEAFEHGLIDEEEFGKKKEDLLREL